MRSWIRHLLGRLEALLSAHSAEAIHWAQRRRVTTFCVVRTMRNPLKSFAAAFMISFAIQTLKRYWRSYLVGNWIRSIEGVFPASAFLDDWITVRVSPRPGSATVEFFKVAQSADDGNGLMVGKVVMSRELGDTSPMPLASEVRDRWVKLPEGSRCKLPAFCAVFSFPAYVETLVGCALDLLDSAYERDRLILGESSPNTEALKEKRKFFGVRFRIEFFASYYLLRFTNAGIHVYREPWEETWRNNRETATSVKVRYIFMTHTRIVARVAFTVVRVRVGSSDPESIDVHERPRSSGR